VLAHAAGLQIAVSIEQPLPRQLVAVQLEQCERELARASLRERQAGGQDRIRKSAALTHQKPVLTV